LEPGDQPASYLGFSRP